MNPTHRTQRPDQAAPSLPLSAGPSLALEERELRELREGPERNGIFRRVHERCVELILAGAPGQTLSVEDAESLVAQAVCDEMRDLLDRSLEAPAVAESLRRALLRVRTRWLRERHDIQGTLQAIAAASEDRQLAIPLKEVARALGGYLAQALDALRPEDRNLLVDEYQLGRFGFDKRGPARSIDVPGLSLFRARKHLRQQLERLLSESIDSRDRENSLLLELRTIVKDQAFFRLLASAEGGAR